jgi:hypothetical protein
MNSKTVHLKDSIIGECWPFGQEKCVVYDLRLLNGPEELVQVLSVGGFLQPATLQRWGGRDGLAHNFGLGGDLLFLSEEEYDKAIIGIFTQNATHDGKPALPVVAYDYEKVIDVLIDLLEGCSREEAVEFHDFNQACAWLGPLTPVYIENLNRKLLVLDLD